MPGKLNVPSIARKFDENNDVDSQTNLLNYMDEKDITHAILTVNSDKTYSLKKDTFTDDPEISAYIVYPSESNGNTIWNIKRLHEDEAKDEPNITASLPSDKGFLILAPSEIVNAYNSINELSDALSTKLNTALETWETTHPKLVFPSSPKYKLDRKQEKQNLLATNIKEHFLQEMEPSNLSPTLDSDPPPLSEMFAKDDSILITPYKQGTGVILAQAYASTEAQSNAIQREFDTIFPPASDITLSPLPSDQPANNRPDYAAILEKINTWAEQTRIEIASAAGLDINSDAIKNSDDFKNAVRVVELEDNKLQIAVKDQGSFIYTPPQLNGRPTATLVTMPEQNPESVFKNMLAVLEIKTAVKISSPNFGDLTDTQKEKEVVRMLAAFQAALAHVPAILPIMSPVDALPDVITKLSTTANSAPLFEQYKVLLNKNKDEAQNPNNSTLRDLAQNNYDTVSRILTPRRPGNGPG